MLNGVNCCGKRLREPEYSKRYLINILFLLAASQAIANLDRVNMSVAAPVLIQHYQWSPATVGVMLSMFNWAYCISLLFAGPFVDWVRARIAYPLQCLSGPRRRSCAERPFASAPWRCSADLSEWARDRCSVRNTRHSRDISQAKASIGSGCLLFRQ